MSTLRKGKRVRDRWWPWRLGVVVWCSTETVRVRWSDGEAWTYDSAHLHFLETAP